MQTAKESQPNEDRLLNTAQVAAMLGIKPNTVRIWRVHGCGPRYFRFGDSLKSQVRYKASEVESWLADRNFSSTSEETAGAGQ